MKLSIKHLISIILAVGVLGAALVFAFPNKSETNNFNSVKLVITHSKCTHQTTTHLDESGTTLTLTEIKSKYPDCKAEINNNKLILTKTEDNYCERHYFAYLKNNTIKIVRLNDGFIIREIPVSIDIFSKDELKSLETGIMLFDTYELTSFIEDYSSWN